MSDFDAMMEKIKRSADVGRNGFEPGDRRFARIEILSDNYVDNLAAQIRDFPVPDDLKIWAKGESHYAMLLYCGNESEK